MKNNFTILLILYSFLAFSQNGSPAAPYYNGFNWNQSGLSLKNALSTHVTNKHTNFLIYTPGVWNATKSTDLDPNNSANVLLVYGWEPGVDGDVTNDLFRGKDSNSGNNGDWNREHVYAKAQGTPGLDDGGTSDAGEDAHHLRSCDVQRNNTRGNLKFAPGSGTSSTVVGGWYPGDMWKGDIARMMMYMYLRYPSQCLPTNIGTGTTTAIDPEMINLFLQWNAEDPVSQYEDNRNTFHGNTANTFAQGNRNPFIDNPYLATVIWGGTAAQNRWPNIFLSTLSFSDISNAKVYPNPVIDGAINIETDIVLDNIELININGQLMQVVNKPILNNNHIKLENISKGFYFLKISSQNQSITKKIIVN